MLGCDWRGFVTKRLKIGMLNLLLLHCGCTSSPGLNQLSPSYCTCMAIAIVLITTTTIIISCCYCLKAPASLAGKEETHAALCERLLWCFNQLNISLLCTIHQLQRGLNEQTLGNFKMRHNVVHAPKSWLISFRSLHLHMCFVERQKENTKKKHKTTHSLNIT